MLQLDLFQDYGPISSLELRAQDPLEARAIVKFIMFISHYCRDSSISSTLMAEAEEAFSRSSCDNVVSFLSASARVQLDKCTEDYFSENKAIYWPVRKLANRGIVFVGDLVQLAPVQIMSMHKFITDEHIMQMRAQLNGHQLRFGMLIPKWKRPFDVPGHEKLFM